MVLLDGSDGVEELLGGGECGVDVEVDAEPSVGGVVPAGDLQHSKPHDSVISPLHPPADRSPVKHRSTVRFRNASQRGADPCRAMMGSDYQLGPSGTRRRRQADAPRRREDPAVRGKPSRVATGLGLTRRVSGGPEIARVRGS